MVSYIFRPQIRCGFLHKDRHSMPIAKKSPMFARASEPDELFLDSPPILSRHQRNGLEFAELKPSISLYFSRRRGYSKEHPGSQESFPRDLSSFYLLKTTSAVRTPSSTTKCYRTTNTHRAANVVATHTHDDKYPAAFREPRTLGSGPLRCIRRIPPPRHNS